MNVEDSRRSYSRPTPVSGSSASLATCGSARAANRPGGSVSPSDPFRCQGVSELTQRQIFERLAEKCRVWPEAALAEHGVAAGIDGQYGAAARAVIRAIDERRGQQAFVFEADPRFGQLGIACDLRIGKGGKQAGGVGFAICAPLRGDRKSTRLHSSH